jgi:GTPase SAR1 family protein
MRTPLTDFSQDFCGAVRPLVADLDGALDELAAEAEEGLRRDLLPELRSRRDQLGVLLRKVEEQQAYVMIFGPLKSGKSTLMNALAGAYVSEVTSLPAYPTVVFVSHAEAASYRVTRYDGTSVQPADAEALREVVDHAHGELAGAVRAAELDGRVVDPASDLPRAIRRIDVALPAEDLGRAEVVLVDTPGLYTRMKFGYDTMTRDFKHAASVAVFVVKADNLFLEQVFEEFSELLDLFSRVFLVLNIDSSRVDLGPGGELVPSLEQREPDRIVRAFEELSMNARLKQAAEQGRLCIYPVDLLHAASARLRGGGPDDTGFERLREDLTGFLESNDYLNAFVSDGLTRAGVLLDELEGACARSEVRHLVERLKALAAERDEARALLGDTRALHELAWERALGRDRRAAVERVRERAGGVLASLQTRTDELLEAWFSSGASLHELVDESLAAIATQAVERLRRAHLAELRTRNDGGARGLGLEAEAAARVERSGLDLVGLGREVLEELEASPLGRSEPDALLAPADVPVKRRLGDWLLLRGRVAVRRRLLGPDGRPDKRVAPALKAKLLGAPAREAMRKAIGEALAALVDRVHEQLDRDLHATFHSELAQRARGALTDCMAELEPRVDELVADVDRRRRVMTHIEKLRQGVELARSGLQQMRGTSAPSLRDVEIVPAAPRRAEVQPAPEEPAPEEPVAEEPVAEGQPAGEPEEPDTAAEESGQPIASSERRE